MTWQAEELLRQGENPETARSSDMFDLIHEIEIQQPDPQIQNNEENSL